MGAGGGWEVWARVRAGGVPQVACVAVLGAAGSWKGLLQVE